MHVGDLLKKKLNRDQVPSQPLPLCIFSAAAHGCGPAQRSADAIKLSGLLRRLGGLRSLSKEWAALFLLHRLAGTPSQLAYQNSAAAPLHPSRLESSRSVCSSAQRASPAKQW